MGIICCTQNNRILVCFQQNGKSALQIICNLSGLVNWSLITGLNELLSIVDKTGLTVKMYYTMMGCAIVIKNAAYPISSKSRDNFKKYFKSLYNSLMSSVPKILKIDCASVDSLVRRYYYLLLFSNSNICL